MLFQVSIISSQVFGHLRSFKGWIQTGACVIHSYLMKSIQWQKWRSKQKNISVASVQPSRKNDKVHLIRYNCTVYAHNSYFENILFILVLILKNFIYSINNRNMNMFLHFLLFIIIMFD